MSSLEGPEYQKVRDALKADPIIQAMAEEMRNAWDNLQSQYVHESGNPRWEFMSACGAEYNKRGGELPHHIGGPAEAILELLKERKSDA